MKDFNGVELQVGDEVAIIAPYIGGLVKAEVVGFTAKMIKCRYIFERQRIYTQEKLHTVEITNRLPIFVSKINK